MFLKTWTESQDIMLAMGLPAAESVFRLQC